MDRVAAFSAMDTNIGGPNDSRSGAGRPYQALVDAMQEGAALVADDGTIVYGNPALGTLTGYAAHSLHGRPFASLLGDGHEHGTALPTEGRTERSITTKDGRQVLVSMSTRRVHADGQDITAVVIADLSGRRRDERLRESEAQQAFLVRLGDALRPVSRSIAASIESSTATSISRATSLRCRVTGRDRVCRASLARCR
jgi:PAS domain S-box-containing protein